MDPLQVNNERFVLFPIKYPEIWKMYKKAESSFWTAEELDLSSDQSDFDNLSDGERHFIELTLAFFAASDGIVNENLASNFMSEVQIPEIRCFYGFQIMMENIHAEVYSLLIQTFVKNPERRHQLFQGIQTFPSIKAKADWAMKWINRDRPFAERLVAFACVEGIAFSSAFASIFYLKKRGLMVHGLGKSNEFISRDEGLHRDFACLLYKSLQDKAPVDTVKSIIEECVQVESQFVQESLPVALIGMNHLAMIEYIQFIADSLAVALGLPKIYNTPNPFDWMENISLQGKTNFFEARVSEYSVANIGSTEQDRQFTMDADF
jgi:ribonucleotide reductase beta subunit family protein with ferritin-like domain